jgi:hypothetical protein
VLENPQTKSVDVGLEAIDERPDGARIALQAPVHQGDLIVSHSRGRLLSFSFGLPCTRRVSFAASLRINEKGQVWNLPWSIRRLLY